MHGGGDERKRIEKNLKKEDWNGIIIVIVLAGAGIGFLLLRADVLRRCS